VAIVVVVAAATALTAVAATVPTAATAPIPTAAAVVAIELSPLSPWLSRDFNYYL